MRSLYFLATTRASFESWFRVELVVVLEQLGVPMNLVDPSFTYPHSNDKADLVVRDPKGLVVFELKSFVEGAESQKLGDFPRQVKRLRRLVEEEIVSQVIAFVTLYGYSQRQLLSRAAGFFAEGPWRVVGPEPTAPFGSLHLLVAAISKTGA